VRFMRVFLRECTRTFSKSTRCASRIVRKFKLIKGEAIHTPEQTPCLEKARRADLCCHQRML
jgi:hypothetical protein